MEKLHGFDIGPREDVTEYEGANTSQSLESNSSLFSDFEQASTAALPQHMSAEDEVNHYFTSPDYKGNKGNAVAYWKESNLRRLSKLANTCLSVPATSAPVERIFSHGGIILRPRRSSMTSKLLTSLLFVKCNRAYN